ncbi:dynamin family protein [Litoreibacter sp.]|nr:dynamin family protein [Litoreibacter sp.]
MNAETKIDARQEGQMTASEVLITSATQELHSYAAALKPLQRALRVIQDFGDEAAQKSAGRLVRQLETFEPSVTMIGQIKSGKTSLVNSMVGLPDLLPADVNPWTSVVTSLHLSPTELSPKTSAKFRFFEHSEWDRLVHGGGRMGELADRAGAEAELSKIKSQVEQMREKTKARLGRKFEMLLGQEHSYGHFDKGLIERYVCLGDDFEGEEDPTNTQGRFADITKSASLFFQQSGLPIKLCVRDTPGVNDTFMMREQITIQSIRDSRICVVVLSAHQALSSTDMGLIRLIANVKSRDVVIYVNRIDELSDPGTQVPQIRNSIEETLAKHHGPSGVQIVFGSALWANHAMSGELIAIPEASKSALLNWAEFADYPVPSQSDPRALLWELSGVPMLYHAVGQRIVEGVGRELMQDVATTAINLIQGIMVSDNISAKTQTDGTQVQMRREDILEASCAIRDRNIEALKRELTELQSTFSDRINRAHDSFLSRATQALIVHLERYGEHSVWEYDPTGLRVLLSSSYKMYGQKCQSSFARNATQSVADLAELYQQALNLPVDLFDTKLPAAPRIPPPVALGQTIALDMKGSWWKSWWFRRRGYQAYAQSFHDLIEAETVGLIADLRDDQANVVSRSMETTFEAFILAQCSMLDSVTEQTSLNADKLDELFDLSTLENRHKELSVALKHLEAYC